MNYITNEEGDIKVRDEKGNFKWFSPAVVRETKLMQSGGFTPVEKPELLEPIDFEKQNVAESAPAKSGRKKQN